MVKRALAAWPQLLMILASAAAIWVFILRPEMQARQLAETKVVAAQAEATGKAASDTLEIVVEHRRTIETINTRTTETNHEILTTPGADAPVDPAVHGAGLRALCLQHGRSDPACVDVLHRDGGGERPQG